MSKTGKTSLKYVNADSHRYVLWTQTVPVQPRWKVRFGVWIKAQDIQGEESGATICLEWQDKDGKWLGGAYPAGVRGTNDWTRIETITRLPEDAAFCMVACYVRQGMTGTAWFDDVEVVRIADPNHPTWIVLYQFREVAAYLRTFDVIGTDPYPIGRSPASMAGQWTAETFRQVEQARPMWQVPQLHNWANYAKSDAEKKGGRTPTFEEVRSMAWQCICEGATGLVFYSWFDVKRNPDAPFDVQWSGLKRLAEEIDRMAPILLSDEPMPSIRVQGEQPRWLHWLARQSGGKTYLMVVNDGDGEGEVSFHLPSIPKSVRLIGEDGSIQSTGTSLQFELPRLAVRCLEIE